MFYVLFRNTLLCAGHSLAELKTKEEASQFIMGHMAGQLDNRQSVSRMEYKIFDTEVNLDKVQGW